jgi:hypothetical protein
VIVTVEGDVEAAARDGALFELADQAGHPAGQRDAARPDADQHDVLDAAVPLHDLVGHPRECPAHLVGRHQGAAGGGSWRCEVAHVAAPPVERGTVRSETRDAGQKKTSATRRIAPASPDHGVIVGSTGSLLAGLTGPS